MFYSFIRYLVSLYASLLCNSVVTYIYFTVLCLAGFTICQFALYACMTIVMQQTSATTVNISLLTADFYTLLFGLFLFKYQVMFNYENSQYTEQYGQYYNMIKIIENVDGLLICH